MDVRREARKLVKRNGVGFVIDDYIQISDAVDKGKNREEELNITAKLNKNTAQMLDIPFMQLSQLDAKGVEKKGHVATMNDVSGSAAISAHSDIFAYIFRDEYAGKNADEHGNSTQGKTKVQFLKFRDGARMSECILSADLAIQKFFPRGTVSIKPSKGELPGANGFVPFNANDPDDLPFGK